MNVNNHNLGTLDMLGNKLRFGAFIAPFHAMDENPTLCLERDLELVQWMDKLGFDEAWIGEHHSAGFELIASPELFIAATLLIVILSSLATAAVGLSPIVGALIAGLLIAETDYRGEVETVVEPFKGLALGVFLPMWELSSAMKGKP